MLSFFSDRFSLLLLGTLFISIASVTTSVQILTNLHLQLPSFLRDDITSLRITRCFYLLYFLLFQIQYFKSRLMIFSLSADTHFGLPMLKKKTLYKISFSVHLSKEKFINQAALGIRKGSESSSQQSTYILSFLLVVFPFSVNFLEVELLFQRLIYT